MASLSRTRSGLWTARKVIPQDIRSAYGKREEKPTWPATLNQSQARAEFGAWLAAVEDRIASLRSQGRAEPIALSQRQSRALAGRWYQEMVESFSDNPGNEIDWDMARESLYPEETEASYRARLTGDQRPYEGPWRIPPFLAEDARRLLERDRLLISEASREQLLAFADSFPMAFRVQPTKRASVDIRSERRIAFGLRFQSTRPLLPIAMKASE